MMLAVYCGTRGPAMCPYVAARFGKVFWGMDFGPFVWKSAPVGIILAWFGPKLAHGKGPEYFWFFVYHKFHNKDFICIKHFVLVGLGIVFSSKEKVLIFPNMQIIRKVNTCEQQILTDNIFQYFNLGSTEERTTLEKAEEYGCKREKSNLPEADVDLVLPTLEVSVGDDFELNMEFINRSDERRVVDAYISGSVVYYTGVTSSEFMLRSPRVTIGPNKSER